MKKEALKKIITKIFKKHNLSLLHSKICADALINAELVGSPSHGLSRLKMYCDRIKKKLINPQPKIKFKKISNSIFHVDANNGMGFISADKAIKKAIYCAKKTGFSPELTTFITTWFTPISADKLIKAIAPKRSILFFCCKLVCSIHLV